MFLQSTPKLRDEARRVLRNIFERNPNLSVEDDSFSSTSIFIDRCFDAPAMARYSVVAEPIRARERAEEEARRVIEVLRFYGMIVYGLEKICLMHESNPRIKSVVVYSDERFMPSESVSGPLKNLELSEAFMEQMEQSGASKLLGLISRYSLTEFFREIVIGAALACGISNAI